MTTIQLTNSDMSACVDIEDAPKVRGYRWYLHSEGYAAAPTYVGRVPGIVYMHKLILDSAALVDHKDGNKLNNCQNNLRAATRQMNGGNRKKSKKPATSQYKWVYWESDRGKWRALLQVQENGRRKVRRLGRFDVEADAALAYNLAAKQFFGEFALLNEVERA